MPDGEIVDTLGTRQDRAARQGRHHPGAGPDGAARAGGGREAQERSTASTAKSSTCARWCRSTPRPSSARSARTHRLFTVEENPRLCGWGAEIVSIVADEAFYDLDGPPVRITTPHIPLPAADILEDIALPTVDRASSETVQRSLAASKRQRKHHGHVRQSPRQCSDRSVDRRQMAQIVRRRPLRRDRPGDREQGRFGRERHGRGRQGRARCGAGRVSRLGRQASRASAPRFCASPTN